MLHSHNILHLDIKPENIVIPRGKGTGLIQVIDGELPPNVMPFLTPTFNMKGMI